MSPDSTVEFSAFYEASRTAVFRALLMARAGDREDSEDAVAEAYARAYLRWDRLAHHPNPTAWVIRTALNHRVSLWRQRRRDDRRFLEASTSIHSEGLDPGLIKLLRRLPKGQREILALRVLLDFSTEQTADVLGVHQGTVKTQLHRALRALRAELMSLELKEMWL